MTPKSIWNKFGTVIDPNDPNPLFTAKLDWRVEKKECYAVGSTSQVAIPECYALIREPGSIYMNPAGPRYTPSQNSELFEYAKKFFGFNEMRLEVAGYTGEWVWFLGRSKYRFSLGTGSDPINVYLLLAFPHQCGDSLRPILFLHRPSNETCMVYSVRIGRQRLPILKEGQWTEPHVEATKQITNLMKEKALDMELKALSMSKVKPTEDEVSSYFQGLRKGTLGKGKIQTSNAVPKLIEFYQYGFGATELHCMGTWWGVYQALCYYIDHHSGAKDEYRLYSSWLGARGDIKRKAFEIAYNLSQNYGKKQTTSIGQPTPVIQTSP